MPAGVKRDPPSSLSLFEMVRNWMASCSLLGVRGEYFYHLYLSNENAWSPRSSKMVYMLLTLYCIVLQKIQTGAQAILEAGEMSLTGSYHVGESCFSEDEMLGHQQSLRLYSASVSPYHSFGGTAHHL